MKKGINFENLKIKTKISPNVTLVNWIRIALKSFF